MEFLHSFVAFLNAHLSDYVLTVLLVGCGIFYTIRTRFVQVRCFGEAWRYALARQQSGKTGFSPFQALATAIAAQVGTGNIVGASGAILTGGPGAIFWMWVIAFFGMATIYAEAVLAIQTREILPDKTICGGPIYYIKKAFPNKFGKFLMFFFAIAATISLGFAGNTIQANSIAEAWANAFGLQPWHVGIFLAILGALVFAGGLKRIANVTTRLVPVMAILYLVCGVIVLCLRAKYLPETIGCIFKYAFTPDALLGGGFGYALKTAISQGIKRGLFSNEAGMGSTPHAHAIADVKDPHQQGAVAMIGVFIDTAVVLTMTALIVISTLYTGDGVLAHANGSNYSTLLAEAGLTKTNLAQIAIGSVSTAVIGNCSIAVFIFFFAFSTILGWYYFGEVNFRWLFGKKLMIFYPILAVAAIFAGSVLKNDFVWEVQDLCNQLMVLPNVLALLALSGMVVKACHLKNKAE